MSEDNPTEAEADRWNLQDWNLEAAEDTHRYRSEEARLDWIEDNYERDES